MPRLARCQILVAALTILIGTPWVLMAADGAVGVHPSTAVSYILIGFAGGFVRHNNPHHGPVKLAQRIRQELPKGDSIQVFENRHRKDAYKTILRMLDSNHDGILSDAEKSQARIIVFGHSWGASAVVLLSRELDRAGIPVLLTIQVDSVQKPWQRDKIIPDNVAEAVNFYQPHGLVHGRAQITAADDSKTQILGNYRFDYQKTPVKCEGTTWFERTFVLAHVESQCDPRLWSQVEDLMRQRIEPPTATALVIP